MEDLLPMEEDRQSSSPEEQRIYQKESNKESDYVDFFPDKYQNQSDTHKVC